MRPRLTAYAKAAAGAAGLVAALFLHPAPASAATVAPAVAAKTVPYPAALRGGHPLTASFAPSAMTSTAWKTGANGPGGCPANPKAVSRSASGDAKLSTTGKAGNCTWIQSPKAMPTRAGYVYEAKVYVSSFKDWPAVWLSGSSWPKQGELDAAEPNFGVNYVTWHQASCSASRADTEISTNPWAYGCKTTVKPSGKNIGPGWHVIDVAWTKAGVSVYYDGKLYVTIHESVTTGKTADPMRVIFSEGSCQNSGSNQCGPGDLGTPGNLQVRYLRVFS